MIRAVVIVAMLGLMSPAWGRNVLAPMRVLAILTALPALAADPLTGKVVGVHDGDTITGLNDNKKQMKIRLDAIERGRGRAFHARVEQSNVLIRLGCAEFLKETGWDS